MSNLEDRVKLLRQLHASKGKCKQCASIKPPWVPQRCACGGKIHQELILNEQTDYFDAEYDETTVELKAYCDRCDDQYENVDERRKKLAQERVEKNRWVKIEKSVDRILNTAIYTHKSAVYYARGAFQTEVRVLPDEKTAIEHAKRFRTFVKTIILAQLKTHLPTRGE